MSPAIEGWWALPSGTTCVPRATPHWWARTHAELDLLDGVAVKRFFDEEQPDYVILAAAHVGGIWANNTLPGRFHI